MSLTSILLIKGISFGGEYIDAVPEEDIERSLIVDLFFLRFLFTLH